MTTQNNQVASKQIYYTLVAAEVIFMMPETESLSAAKINTVIRSESPNIPARLLGRAQQTVQMTLIQRMNEPKIEIRDVVVLGLSPMGCMTEEEFSAQPEGMKLQEKGQ